MIVTKAPFENSTIVEPPSELNANVKVEPTSLLTTALSTATLNQADDRNTLKKIAACHRQFYHRLSHVSTTNTNTIPTTLNVNDSNIMMAATTSTCNDKKMSSTAAEESAEKNVIVHPFRNSNDQLNDPPPTSTSASSFIAESNDSGRVIDDVKTIPPNDNVMHVLNSPAVVSRRLLRESLSPEVAAATIGVSKGTESHEGCRLLWIEGEATICRRRRCSEAPMAAAYLIGKTIDVNNITDGGSDFPTHTTTNETFGSGVDIICSGGGSIDVSNDNLCKKITLPTTNKRTTMKSTTTAVQCQSLLPQPPVNNQNKCTCTEEPNVSCHSTFKTFTSSLPSQSRLCLSFSGVHLSSSTLGRRSLIEERKRDLFECSQEDTRARSRSRSPITEELRRNSPSFPSVDRLVKMYTKILQDNKQPATVKDTVNIIAQDLEQKLSLKEDDDQLKPRTDPHRSSPLSDEGCNLGQSPYSSDCEEDQDYDKKAVKPAKKRKGRVARSVSSDSALGLEDDAMEPPVNLNQGRRLTLTVTDLPLRPALLPLAEPTDLPDSPTADVHISLNALLNQTAIPSKVLIEERVVEIPEDRFGSISSSRRESAQSCISDYPNSECSGVRFMRTPSVVVSDYSDDLMCGITLEEIEYFRAQRLRRRSSVDTSGTEKDDGASDISATSSCSNLYYCGSTISALDGAECYVNGIRMPIERKISDCSTFEGSGDEDSQSFVIPEQPEDLKEYISYCTDQMLAQQQQAIRKPKKVGGTIHNTNTDTCNTNSNSIEP